jgi:tetratricopeptide (TPR) repeat protein
MLAFLIALSLVLSSAPQDQSSTEEEKIRGALDALVKAMAGRDRAGISACFHPRRMIKELDAQGFKLPGTGPEKEEQGIRALQAALPSIAGNMAAIGTAWEKIRTLGVHFQPGAEEVEALCRVTAGGSKTRMRFWLVKEEGAWKIFDFEVQEGNMRLSVTVGAIAANLGADEKTRKAMMTAFVALRKAAVQLGSGDADEAHKIIQEALGDDPPGIMRAWMELIDTQALLVLEKHGDAIKAADRLLGHQKDMFVAHHLKAAALFELGEYEKCIESEREFLKNMGDDAEAWIVVGNAHDKLHQADKAIEAYRKGAAADDEEFANRLQLGRLLIAAGRAAEARPVLKEASRNGTPEDDAFEQAAGFLDGAGDAIGTLELAEERIKRTPDDATVLAWQGKSLRKLKRFDEAEKVLRPAVEKNKDERELAEELIFTLAQAGKEREAMERSDAMAGEDADRARFLRAFVHVTAGRAGKAIEELRAMLEADADGVEEIEKEPVFEKLRQEVDLQIVIGRAKARRAFLNEVGRLSEKEDWDGVLKISKEQAGATPEDRYAHYYQGYALRRLGRPFDAELAFKAAIAKSKDNTDFSAEFAKALAAQGKLDEALALADRVLAESKAEETGLLIRVLAYALVKKSDPALKALDVLLEKHPEWRHVVEGDADLAEFLKLEACQELLKRAKERDGKHK